MIDGTDGTITGDHKGHDEEPDGHDGNCLLVGETNGDDTAGKLPCRCVERI